MSRGEHNSDSGPDLEQDSCGLLPEGVSRPGLFLMTNSLETGGSERQFAALARSLNPEAFQIHLGCIQRRGTLLDALGYMPEFPLGGSLYGLKSLWTRLRLAQFLRRNNIAVAHAFDLYSNLTLIPAARLAGLPVIIGSQRQLGDLLSRPKSRVQAAVFGWCDAVVCNSRAAADQLVEQGVRESRVVVIGNGLPDSAFAKTPAAVPRRSGVLRVGMIARMNAKSKNHKIVLRAAARLCNRFHTLEFLLVGDGPFRPELEHEAESLGLKGQVLFLGDRQDIPAVLASLDISVQPSSSESLSNVILESMAAGVPVIASRVGGNPELLTLDRGVLVAPNDDKALSDAIQRLLQDANMRANLARKARQFAWANFRLEHICKLYEQLYADLLGKKGWTASRNWSRDPPPRMRRDRIRVAVVAASQRYVGGQSAQAQVLLGHWQHDAAIEARFIPIDPPFPQPIAWAGRIPFLRTLIREPIYLVSLWRGLKDVEVAHIFSASYWSFLVAPFPAWFISRLHGTKTVIHYHSGEARDHLRRFHSVRPVLEDADRLVVPSRYLVDVFREFRLQAQVVPNIVDLTQFRFRERGRLHPHLVCTRGFHPYYCPDIVVRAFAEIRQAFPEAKLDLVGRGPLETQIRSLIRELNLSGVNFAGAVPHHDISRLYDAADIFINASRLDNMPVSILEAFASGLPVVSTAPEGMSYLVKHERTGLLSKPGDARALADNVMRLLRDSELASRLALNAHAEAQRYSWEAVREQWLELYRSLEQGRGQVTPLTSNQTAALNGSGRIEPESRDSPSMQTRNHSSKFNSLQMRSQ